MRRLETLLTKLKRLSEEAPPGDSLSASKLNAAYEAYQKAQCQVVLTQDPDAMGLEAGDIVENRNIHDKAKVLGKFEVRAEADGFCYRPRTWMEVLSLASVDLGKRFFTPVDQWFKVGHSDTTPTELRDQNGCLI